MQETSDAAAALILALTRPLCRAVTAACDGGPPTLRTVRSALIGLGLPDAQVSDVGPALCTAMRHGRDIGAELLALAALAAAAPDTAPAPPPRLFSLEPPIAPAAPPAAPPAPPAPPAAPEPEPEAEAEEERAELDIKARIEELARISEEVAKVAAAAVGIDAAASLDAAAAEVSAQHRVEASPAPRVKPASPVAPMEVEAEEEEAVEAAAAKEEVLAPVAAPVAAPAARPKPVAWNTDDVTDATEEEPAHAEEARTLEPVPTSHRITTGNLRSAHPQPRAPTFLTSQAKENATVAVAAKGKGVAWNAEAGADEAGGMAPDAKAEMVSVPLKAVQPVARPKGVFFEC